MATHKPLPPFRSPMEKVVRNIAKAYGEKPRAVEVKMVGATDVEHFVKTIEEARKKPRKTLLNFP
ncbi:MAG: hypothetical protein ABJF10_05395 [Chthoniobacter sp.]|uniref:hypothetical protein n=1 Tax=Chthoniobacter sp. TaxID=2510640 RepID=UPI0032ADC389